MQKKLSRDTLLLIYALIFLALIFYGTSVSMAYADNRGQKGHDEGILVGHLIDLGHDSLDWMFGRNWNINPNSNDYVLGALMIFTFFYILFTQTGKRIQIYKRWVLCVATIFLIRDFSVIATVSPWAKYYVLDHSCEHWSNVWAAPYGMVFKSRRTCYDTFFSGHTANATICALVITLYQLKNKLISRIILFIMWSLVLLDILFILHLQVHFTQDVIVGFIFSILFWLIIDYQIQLQTGFYSWWEKNPTHYSHQNNDSNDIMKNQKNNRVSYPNNNSNDEETPIKIKIDNNNNNNNNNSNNIQNNDDVDSSL